MDLFRGEPIQSWWNRVSVGKQHMGSGRSSEAYKVSDAGQVYIVRVTDVSNLMRKKIVQHEIEIYQHILRYPNYTRHISERLFSYCPPLRSTDHTAFFIFRFQLGMPLDGLIAFFQERQWILKQETVNLWRQQLQETAAFLRSISIVHRDIKPANLYLDSESNRLLLFDFDTACFVGDDCRTTDFRGTPAYATENARRLLHQVGFPTPYQYTHADDLHAIEVLFQRDVQAMEGGSNMRSL